MSVEFSSCPAEASGEEVPTAMALIDSNEIECITSSPGSIVTGVSIIL